VLGGPGLAQGSQVGWDAEEPDAGTGFGRTSDAVARGVRAADGGTLMAGRDPGRAPIGPVAVVIPTYNERENLEDIVAGIRAAVPEADLLIVDDNSPDGTGDLADKLALTDEHVQVLHRTQKAGLGAAYLAGFGWALDRGYGALVEMDADGSHDPAELPALLAALATADLVVGSRWVTGGTVRNWPRSREILSRGGNAYARMALGLSVHDATGGYRAYRAEALRDLGLHNVRSQGYCFQIELTARAAQAAKVIAEVPITFTERARGTSKMSKAIVAEALLRVTQWGITRHFRPDRG
jgi:dolichol-phosphate mannosyltransferase